MKRPKHFWPILASFCGAIALVSVGFALGRIRGKSIEPSEEGGVPSTVATVKVAFIQKGKLDGHTTLFGAIVAAPGALQSHSVPYECQVASIAVREGQFVEAGAALATVTDSPDARLGLEQAHIDLRAAEVQLTQVKERLALKLADNAQAAQAQQSFDSAQAKVKSLEARQMGRVHVLQAVAPGVVTRLACQVGAIVPAGTTVLEMVNPARLEARLGLEPQEARPAPPGSAVDLSVVDGAGRAAFHGTLRALSPIINPTTRLRDAYVTLPSGHPFLFGQYVRGSLAATAGAGFLVPYAAVLPEEGKQVLYTVRNNHAVRHEVQILSQGGELLQVTAQGLDSNEPVVVQGNYELADGMALRVEGSSR